MIRKSFLRNIPIEQIVIQDWDLPAIGNHKIGFGICPESGLIMQSPCPNPKVVNRYYSETATYINPGRAGKPAKNKIKDLNRLINTVIDVNEKISNNVFQVGCSDGYTLHRFKEAGSNVVTGIDPSNESHKIAQKLYNIDTIVGTFEDYTSNNIRYDLIILTHVLEHLFNPIDTLKKCNLMQNEADLLLIEVPLFERLDCFPPGMLTFEHLNYFSESTLIETLSIAGYEPSVISKVFYNNEYPVITIIAKKVKNTQIRKSNDYNRSKKLLIDYIDKENQNWNKIENIIRKSVKKDSNVYIYGAGIHSSQLLAFTNIKKHLKIKGFLDSSNTKWGKRIGDFMCFSPEKVKLHKDDTIIISSYASEDEIFKNLLKFRQKGIKALKLYS